MRLGVSIIATMAALAGPAFARGVSPYLPLDLAPEIERQIERVLLYADRAVLTRPIAAATVLDALPAACARDQALCDDVRTYLDGYMRGAGLTHASLALGTDSGTPTALPNRHGMSSDSAYELSASGFWQPTDFMLLSAGLLAYDGTTSPTGTMLSLGFEYLQIDLGYRDHWFSPLQSHAMPIATQAETMPSLTISNYTPLTRFNLRYETFLAEMSESSRIQYQDGYTTGNPGLIGLHLSIEPIPGWSIGVNRIMQFGGGERGGHSLGDVLQAFFDPAGNDNQGANLTSDEEFGNQIASITSEIVIPGSRPFSVYFEYAGEDTSTLDNRRLGNTALSVGLHIPDLPGRVELTLELAEWQNGWYEHGIYQDGLRNEGHVIGHWAGDWRTLGDGVGGVGGASALIRVGWPLRSGAWLEAQYRTLDNESYTTTDYERGSLLEILYSHRWGEYRVGVELDVGQDVFGNSFSRLAGFWRF